MRQPHHLGERELAEPLAVEAHLGAIGVEDAEDLPGELLRVRVELLVREHRPLGRAARRVADPRGVVADDQHDDVAGVLPLAQPVEHDREAEMDVRRGRVDAELHAQRAPVLQLGLEPALGQNVHRMARRDEGFHESELVIRSEVPRVWERA